jgi:hypothetical protein
MPTVTIATDKTEYTPGEQIVVTMTVVPDDAVTYNYEARGSVAIDGSTVNRYSPFTVVKDSVVGDPSAFIYAGSGSPAIALTPHPTQANTWIGTAPAA